MPSPGTEIPIEIHAFYAGKTWDFTTTLVVPTASSEKPTYTSNNVQLDHGTYGNTNIRTLISDESGNDLYDGNYGKYDWMKSNTVKSVEDYWARYDDQKGYGIPWVSWQSYYSPAVITIDMKTATTVSQIGLHCYYRTPDIFLPNALEISVSNDATNFQPIQTTGFSYPGLVDDSVRWVNIDFGPKTARYFKLTINTLWPGDLFMDEISINGLDGGKY